MSIGDERAEDGPMPEGWGVRRLVDLAGISMGQSPESKNYNCAGKGVPLIQGNADIENRRSIARVWSTHVTKKGNVGDLLLTVRAPVGAVGRITEDCCIGRGVCAVKPMGSTDFLFHALVFAEPLWKYLEQGSTFTSANSRQVEAFSVAVPRNISEQRAIAEALNDADGLIDSLARLIAKKRNIKKAVMQQLLTGKRRLPGFKGEWEVNELGGLVERVVGGGTPSRNNPAFWGSEIPWVTVKDFSTFNPRLTQESITDIGLRSSASNLIPAGSLIISTRMALGKAVIYDVDVAINQDLKALLLKPEVNAGFLYYWFALSRRDIDVLGSGSTVKGISTAELKSLKLSMPSFSEQSAIAEVLGDMDGEIFALEKRLAKTKNIKKAMMQELLTGKTRLV